MTTLGYYPGCSLHGTGRELDMSIKALAEVAGVELKEIEDWNCCGATAAHNLNHDLAVALPYRNLALAEEQGLSEVLAPCAACFSRMKGTTVRLARSAELVEKMRGITGREFKGTVRILRDAALRAAGCEVVPWNFAVECCGGGFSMSMTDAVVDLSNAILTDAEQAGAEAIVTGCPMCHSNLDMRQRTINEAGLGPHDLPIVYLSEILGLAAGIEPERLGLDRHFVDAMRVVERSA